MNIEDFCIALSRLHLTQPMQAVAVLWFLDNRQPGAASTSGEIARAIRDAGLGTPHSTRLGEAVMKSGHVIKSGDRFRLKPTSRESIEKLVSAILTKTKPAIDHDNGFLSESIWKDTRTYVEKIAVQINGCYEYGYYDAASVLIRRLIETLLIECYEHLNIADVIKRGGNYPMLSEIIIATVDQGGLSLARETKSVLKEIKTVGDRAAHNRRYNAIKADLDKIRSGVRLAVEELLHVASLK